MRRSACFLSLIGLLISPVWAQAPAPAPAAPPPPASPAPAPAGQTIDLPVTRAVLFSSGVGYFEHSGTVDGNATLRLMFKTSQINDVLKSMVLMDLSGHGTVDSVTYGANEPVSRALKSFGVDISANPPLHDLLNQLRGTKVTVTVPNAITGSILNVEAHTRVVGTPPAEIKEYILDLVTAAGIQPVPLDSISSLTFDDAHLRQELGQALALLTSARDTERKPVDIKFTGQGRREVRVGYLVETPVWKTSYRLDLSGKKPFLQGWAIVENTSDNDWSHVTLSLVSGRPISFIQDLYTPLYLPRPVVRPEYVTALQPRLYEEGIPEGQNQLQKRAAREMDALPAGPAAGMGFGGGVGRRMEIAMKAAAAPAAVSLADAGVTSVAYGQAAGELFRFTIANPVDLPRRRSAMLPIINQAVNAEKVSIYNSRVNARFPLNGAILTNNTDLNLPAGPVTVYDGGMYAGDAQLDNLQRGDKRLLAYAEDLDVTVDPSLSSTSHIASASLIKGILNITRLISYTQTYRIQNKATAAKTLIVEYPFYPGRKLVEPAKYEEKTASLYRFRVPVKAESTSDFVIKEDQPTGEVVALLDRPVDNLMIYFNNQAIPQKVRDALAQAIQLKNALTDAQRELDQLTAELASINSDQARLRPNLQVVGRDSPLGKRYVEKLGQEEDRIEKLQGQNGQPGLIDQARQKVHAARAALEDYLAKLNITG